MRGKDRAELRAEAHHLQPLVHIGHLGLTASALQTIDDALRSRELVKLAVSRTIDAEPRVLANELASSLGAEVIQAIGRKVTLYRFNPELHQREGELPAWRR